MDKNFFEKKLQPILNYVGSIGALLTGIAYLILVFVLIMGHTQNTLLETTIFGVINAAAGFCIMQFLKIQGQSFAESLPDNAALIKEYYSLKTKDKKLHSMKFYWLTSIPKDIFFKCISLAGSSIGVIYFVIKGNGNWSWLMMAIINLIMFVCFGFLALNQAYNFFNNHQVPYMKEKIAEIKELKK